MMHSKTTRFFAGLIAALALGLVAALPASAIEIRPNTFNFGYNGKQTEPIVGPFFSGSRYRLPLARKALRRTAGGGEPTGI